MIKRSLFLSGSSAVILLALPCHGLAGNFTISTASTTAQTLGSGSGQTGTITSSGTLTVGGTTNAVTISGNNATLTNNGTISQTGTARVIRDNTGVTGLIINNNAGAVMQAADSDVIQMNKSPASVTLNNYGTMTSLNASAGGSQAVDFNAILSGTNIVNNFATGIMQASEADAVRPGVNGVVNNAGTIKSTTGTGSSSDGIDAQTNSGISVTNSGLVEGARHGITGGNTTLPGAYTMGITNDLGGTVQGDNGAGVNIDGLNANEVVTIVNHGTITGNGISGDGDGVDVDGLVNLNNTGTIRSINSFSSTLPAQSEGVTVGGGTIINSGTIEGKVASGNTNAVGRGITLAGVDTSGTPEPIYGNSSVTNSGLIKGQSDSGIAVGGAASGFTVTITNEAGGTIEGGGSTAAAIQTGADNDTVVNSGTIVADASNKAVDLGAGNDSLQVFGGMAAITGDVSGGTGANTATLDPGTGHSFSYAGSLSNFGNVEVKSGTVTLSGVNAYTGTTQVSGGVLVLEGANRLSSASALFMDGGSVEFSGVGAVDGQTFSSLSLAGNSTLDLGGTTSVLFEAFGGLTAGATLAILNYDASLSPAYAIGIRGDFTSDTALIDAITINGRAAAVSFDGSNTNFSVTAVPEPSTVTIAFALVGLVAFRARRRLGLGGLLRNLAAR